MLEVLKKSLWTGVGIVSLTREKIEEMAKSIAQESKLSEQEGKKLVEEFVKKSDEAKAGVEKIVQERMETFLQKMQIPTRKDMQSLEQRVASIEKALHERIQTSQS